MFSRPLKMFSIFCWMSPWRPICCKCSCVTNYVLVLCFFFFYISSTFHLRIWGEVIQPLPWWGFRQRRKRGGRWRRRMWSLSGSSDDVIPEDSSQSLCGPDPQQNDPWPQPQYSIVPTKKNVSREVLSFPKSIFDRCDVCTKYNIEKKKKGSGTKVWLRLQENGPGGILFSEAQALFFANSCSIGRTLSTTRHFHFRKRRSLMHDCFLL